jgi:hypothetical protein
MSILGLFPPLTLYFTHLPWYSILSLSISIWILSGFRTCKSPPTCSIFTTSRPYNLNTLYLYLYLNYMVRDKAQPRIMASQQPNLEGSQRQVRGCGPEAVRPFPALVILHSTKVILHSANILSAIGSLPSTFFGHSTKTLPSVEKHSAN